jgi:saccharopine dehydrogenase-like NADP-dependent oxidoreductase
MTNNIFIAGAGGIGEATAILLREWSDGVNNIFLGDVNPRQLEKTKAAVLLDSPAASRVETVLMASGELSRELRDAFTVCGIILDCSPGSEAPRMARYARDFGMHYANLTEYVAETEEIMSLADGAATGFILQTGLAPGFINVLAMSLYRKFVSRFGNEKVERIGMKVGALTPNAQAPHFYGFTWSPIGVATEYVKSSRVIREYEIIEEAALSRREKIIIDGRTFEADLTSGGAADLPEFFRGLARSLDYKTLRHPGHYDWVESVIASIKSQSEMPASLEKAMLDAVPVVDDDLVLAHAFVEGYDDTGVRRMIEKAFFVEPLEINRKFLRAIQTTTAAPLCQSAMMLLTGKYKGVILQSQIDPGEFLHGRFVQNVYGI